MFAFWQIHINNIKSQIWNRGQSLNNVAAARFWNTDISISLKKVQILSCNSFIYTKNTQTQILRYCI